MNAVTAVARDTKDPETKWRLESLGGRFLPKPIRHHPQDPRVVSADPSRSNVTETVPSRLLRLVRLDRNLKRRPARLDRFQFSQDIEPLIDRTHEGKISCSQAGIMRYYTVRDEDYIA